MVQEFQVVRCFSCLSFQSQQVCKKPKFTCKVCGEKQSVRKEYGRGTGKECRIHVQKLNRLQGDLELDHEKKLEIQLENQVYDEHLVNNSFEEHGRYNEYNDEQEDSEIHAEDSTIHAPGHSNTVHMAEKVMGQRSRSKWSTFLGSDDMDDSDDEDHSGFPLRQKHLQTQSVNEDKRCIVECSNLQRKINNLPGGSSKKGKMKQETITAFMPSLESQKSRTRNEAIHSEQGNFSALRMHKRSLQESHSIGEDRIFSKPYSSVRNSKLETTFNQESVVQTLVPAKRAIEDPQNSFYKRFSHDNIRHKEEDDTLEPSSKNESVSNKLMKCIGQNRGDFDAQKCKSVLKDANSLLYQKSDCFNLNKQPELHSFLKNSNNAAFKKYELVDDLEDINFDL
ncbi:MRN complex-interacting protein [Palaemon carinicauda]|uniref:MRN complex-interacting protein n=1 Tax=Palaemon carinicauda TaxID=392227 RepID=UPI0035B69195